VQPRLFTLEEATALLPRLRDLLPRLQARKRDLDRLSEELEGLLGRSAGNGHHLSDQVDRARSELDARGREIEDMMAELSGLGCELKGIEEGLVDFPSLRAGRVVYLCWRLGEPAIEWWHDLSAGFAGRQRL
jgi:hypothetical protein